MTSPSLVESPQVDDWLRIEPDGSVTVLTGKVEIGQHIGAALRMVVAEELSIDPARVHVAAPDTAFSPDEGYTSGSNSVQHSGTALQLAGATARAVLIRRAARVFGVGAETIECVDGLLRHGASNRTANYAEIMDGQRFDAPVDVAAVVRSSTDLAVVGVDGPMERLAEIVLGTAVYVHDLNWPDMVHARVLRPPGYHARLVQAPERFEGGRASLTIIRDGSFLAVAGEDEYAVVRAAEWLEREVRWELHGALDTADVFEQIDRLPRTSRAVIDGTPVPGDAPSILPDPPADAERTVAARYERPYQMHASIGPSAGVAHYDGATLSVWSATQGVYPLRGSIAEALGMAPARVRIRHVPGAGCYGHNGADDAAFDAAIVARAMIGRHVLLKWNRLQEHAWEPYAPCMAVELRASLDSSGRVVDWCHASLGDTHRARPRPGPGGAGPARLLAARHLASPAPEYAPTPNMARHAGLHRNADPFYDFAQRTVTKHLVHGLPLRTSAMRTLGAFANVFAIESFMDELAEHAGVDALEFRRRHLSDQRALAVLEQAADAIGWPATTPRDGHGIGFAVAQYKNAQAYAAVGVCLHIDEAAVVHLDRAVVVGDAGRVVDRRGLAAQLEGGFVQAASWALLEEVTFEPEGITSIDWESYPIARFSMIPPIDVQLIDHPELPSLGAGEASSGPAGAAIANAIHRASGVRSRRMPFTPANLRAAALAD